MVMNYEHCREGRPDTPLENEACCEDSEGEPATTQIPLALPGFCTPFCKAERQGWYCHECTDDPHVRRRLDKHGDLVHNGAYKTTIDSPSGASLTLVISEF